MNSLIKIPSESSALTPKRLEEIMSQIKISLQGRVKEAYVFGSASEGKIKEESDIDLILIKDEVSEPFVKRPFEFLDLLDIFPRIDILVYTPKELETQLADSAIGFWKSVRLSMKRIL